MLAGFTVTHRGISDRHSDEGRIAIAHEAPLNPLWSEYGVRFDGATDDTAAWNKLITAITGVQGAEIYVPPVGTSIVSQLTFPINSTDLVVRGGGSRNSGGSCRLLSHYAGSGAVVTFNAATGLRWSGCSVYNDSASFTGKLVDLSRGAGSKDTTQFKIEDCRLNAVAQAASTVRLLQLTKATIGRIEGVFFNGGGYGIEGLTTAGDYCNSVTVADGCLFQNQDTIPIHNLGSICRVQDATFEPLRSGAAGAYLQDSTLPFAGTLLWLGNWTGDSNGTGTWVTFCGDTLISLSDFESCAQAILLNQEVRLLAVGGWMNLGTGFAINFNGQRCRSFQNLGMHGGPNMYTGASISLGAGGGMVSGVPAVQVVKTGTQAITTAATTAMAWDAENFDTLGASVQWAAGSSTRLTAQAPGVYRLSASVVFAANATGERAVWFRKNGATFLPGLRVPATAANATATAAATTVILNASDYVECFVYQNSGGNLNVQVNDAQTSIPTAFGMEKIG